MRKFTYYLLFLLLLFSTGYAQVQVGQGDNQDQDVPFQPYYGYTYAQSVYMASEINASGTITGIQWYYSGSSNFSNQQIAVYLGHSDRTTFTSSSDFEAVTELNLVYTGTLSVTAGVPGWTTIVLDQPFAYNGTENLIVAVNENLAGYNSFDDDFHCWDSGSARSIYAYSDSTNILPTDPTNDGGFFVNRGITNFVPNIIFEGIQQLCPNPSGLTVSDITTTSASFEWISDGTAWQVLVLEEGDPAPTGSTSGTPVATNSVYTDATLDAQTNYKFYVRQVCGTEYSGWIGPLSFITQCLPFEEINENFDSTATTGVAPECWTRIRVSTSAYATSQVVGYSSSSQPNAYELYNSDDAGATLMLVSPALTDLPAGTHRVKFKATGYDYPLSVGTMTDPSDPETYSEIELITVAEGYNLYAIELQSSTDSHIAFRHALGGTYRTIHIDDIIWEETPIAPPLCLEDVAVTPNAECGNYATTFSWSPVTGADGYYISIGTAPAANDIVDNADLAYAHSYSFTGEADTTYYYTVTPYNINGTAVDCEEVTFETAADPCYCISLPTSNDGLGITNVQLGTTQFPTTDVTYFDHTGDSVDLAQGLNTNVQITFATGYEYFTYIYIDFDDSMSFEPEELVFSGESLDANPTTYNASFIMPEDAAEGAHRMRIVTADYLVPGDPCYSGTYGVTLDFAVNIVIPACVAPEALTTIVADCDNNQFYVDVDVVGLGSGSPVITDGTASWPVTEIGIVQVGPFVNGSTVNLVFEHGTEEICNLPLGIFTYICPPSCDNAIEIAECGVDVVASIAAGNGSWNGEFCGYGTPGRELVYSFTPTYTGVYSINVTAADWNYIDYAWKAANDSCDQTGWTCIDDISFTGSFTMGTFEEGVEYLILLDSEGTSARTHTFNVACAPTCTDPTVGYYIVPDCEEDEQFFVDVNITNLGTATSLTVSDNAGSTPEVVTQTGIVQFGPYANGTSVVFTVVNDQDASCELTSSTLVQASCPPLYDSLCDAMPIVVDAQTANNAFTLVSTTAQAGEPVGSCFNNGIGGSAWFSFIAPPSGEVIITTDIAGSQLTDTEIALYASTGVVCTDLSTLSAAIDCDQDGGETVNYNSTITRTGGNALTPGDMYYVQVDRWGTTTPGTFGLRITDANPLSTESLLNGGFGFYPNPVSNILNLSHKQNISQVEVFNLLGQQVLSKVTSSSQVQLDMTSLSAGSYLVKVTSEHAVKTIKVIKN